MKNVVTRWTTVVVIAVGLLVTLSAKGPTVKLTITGPGLTQPLEVTTPDALAHVWGDDFIGSPATEPDTQLPRHMVSFHVQPNGSGDARVMYVIQYARNPNTGEGFVYLPGPGEEWYWLNVGTIHRQSHNGRWHHAVDRWNEAISASIQ